MPPLPGIDGLCRRNGAGVRVFLRPFRAAHTLEKLARLESIRLGDPPSILLNECDFQNLRNPVKKE